GGISLFMLNGLNLGVDFTGGTLVYVKFEDTPDLARIREVLSSSELQAQEVTRFDEPGANQVQIRIARASEEAEAEEDQDLTQQWRAVTEVLQREFGVQAGEGQPDINAVSREDLAFFLTEADPERIKEGSSVGQVESRYRELADQIVGYRTSQGGFLRDISDLRSAGLPDWVVSAMEGNYYAENFTVLSVESVGPKVGRELRERAQNAILFSLGGMLIYIAFRFQVIYGVAAIVALTHDVFLTLGFFSITGKEISLTVIAGLLTLVGYSINDTIVIFDRVRENLKLMRRADFKSVLNASINQSLNRTILTSASTFLAVMALYLLGGPALDAFAFALVVGIIVGTYSSVALAAPIVLWWQSYSERRKARA